MVDLAVEFDDEFEFADRVVELALGAVAHGDVVPRDRFTSAVTDVTLEGEGLVVEREGLLAVL